MLTLTRRSVTVDLAAEAGGNVETTEPGKVIRTKNGVTCIGYTDLPGRCAAQSSTLFGNNVANFILSMGDAKEGRFEIRHDDEAVRGALVTQDFQTMFPPPAPKPKQSSKPGANNIISSVSKAGSSNDKDEEASEETPSKGPPAWLGDAKSATIFGTFLALMCVIGAAGPPAEAIGIVSAFSLACIVGYFAVTGVTGESSFYFPLIMGDSIDVVFYHSRAALAFDVRHQRHLGYDRDRRPGTDAGRFDSDGYRRDLRGRGGGHVRSEHRGRVPDDWAHGELIFIYVRVGN